jgi:hypothetical protein
MLSRLALFAKKLWSRLSTSANQLFRRLTQPARSNLVTGTPHWLISRAAGRNCSLRMLSCVSN